MIEIKNLHTYFYTETGVSYAVEGASFSIRKGETLALVGESGCGKTITALSIMRLIFSPPGEIVEGEIIFEDRNLLNLTEEKMRTIRGRHIAMVFQEPMSSLNPLYTVGYQIGETLLAHKKVKRGQVKEKVVQLLERVEIPSPEKSYSDYPHNLSGGLRQRVMIAQALSCEPKLLIADEPTTALDVTIQAQILKLFAGLKETTDMSILLITHDLGIVAEVADRVCVMYAGRVVEEADVFTLFSHPQHPYTQGLLGSLPRHRLPRQKLSVIRGSVPDPKRKPSGCAFHPRCSLADVICERQMPLLSEREKSHKVSCWKAK